MVVGLMTRLGAFLMEWRATIQLIQFTGALAMLLVLLQRWRRTTGVVAFFHPYCNDGGGGERVLWCAVQALLDQDKKILIVIYTGDRVSKEKILSKAKERFGFAVDGRRIRFVPLYFRWIVEARYYPVFTLLGQSIGGALLALEALLRLNPEVFIDTMGVASSYPIARYIFGSKVACYVHYPAISTDMLSLVGRREASYNNRTIISNSYVLSRVKVVYYQMLAFVYGLQGACAHAVLCNSSWTAEHIMDLWGIDPRIVPPPCNTQDLQQLDLGGREPLIVSLGQFRPEKNHALQLAAFEILVERGRVSDARLAILGSCRNAEDEGRVLDVRRRIAELGLEGRAEVHTNVPWGELQNTWLRRAKVGVHTMWNEHFGINVVEFMAAGAVPVAHDSGGPREDIVVELDGLPTGFRATTPEQYARACERVLTMYPQECAPAPGAPRHPRPAPQEFAGRLPQRWPTATAGAGQLGVRHRRPRAAAAQQTRGGARQQVRTAAGARA